MRLGQMAGDAGIEVPEEIADVLRRLSRHYIPARYPDAHPAGSPGAHYGASDAEEALRDAGRLVAFVDRAWEAFSG